MTKDLNKQISEGKKAQIPRRTLMKEALVI